MDGGIWMILTRLIKEGECLSMTVKALLTVNLKTYEAAILKEVNKEAFLMTSIKAINGNTMILEIETIGNAGMEGDFND